MFSDNEVKQKIKEKAADAVNRIYLYCEDNKLTRNSVLVKYVSEYEFRVAILHNVNFQHRAEIVKIIKEFNDELDELKMSCDWDSRMASISPN